MHACLSCSFPLSCRVMITRFNDQVLIASIVLKEENDNYQPERGAVLRLLYVFRVCLFVCLFVSLCVRTYHVRNIYVIRYYATAVYSSVWRFADQATANEGSFVLPRWRKRDR